MAGQAGAEGVGQALAQDRGGNVGVKDDNAHASPARREARMNEMNSSSSSSDSKRSGQASSSTDLMGRMPCRRRSSSAGTCPAVPQEGWEPALLLVMTSRSFHSRSSP